MGFDDFSKIAGYDDYFGRTEYNNEKDYDGNWGIWGEEMGEMVMVGVGSGRMIWILRVEDSVQLLLFGQCVDSTLHSNQLL